MLEVFGCVGFSFGLRTEKKGGLAHIEEERGRLGVCVGRGCQEE